MLDASDIHKNIRYVHEIAADHRIEKACYEYLFKLGYSLYANWDIQREERRRIAAGWLAFQVEGVLDEMRAVDMAKAFGQSRWRRWKEKFGRGTRLR